MNRILIRYIGFSLVAAVMMLAGSTALAQGSDGQYVIKVRGNGHYLAHVRNSNGDYVLGDLTSFSPECLWYSGIEFNISGTNHNYYFYDTVTENYRYITAPMRPNGTLGLSDDMPATYLLSNTDTIYYFYDWDSEANGDGGGLARGLQFSSINTQQNCSDCGHVWGDEQCWDVYWIAYKEGDGWKTSPNCYDIDGLSGGVIGGRFHSVGVEFHPKVVSGVSEGALATLSNWEPTEPSSKLYNVNATSYTYTFVPEYNTYTFREMETDSSFSNHSYHYSGNQQVTPPLGQQTATAIAPKSYEWSLTGDAAEFLSFASSSSPVVHTLNGNISGTSQDLSATVYYVESNRTGTKTATLKLVVTYADGSTQERTATITLTTECQNPPQSISPVVNYDDVLVMWYDIADSYKVYWKKTTDASFTHSHDATENYFVFEDLEPNLTYQYKVNAICSGEEQTTPENIYSFTTHQAHELLVYGSIFGGGRMANVTGKTEVVVVNCDSIGAIYGGNDIAGTVLGNEGNDGAKITLGVNEGDDDASYGTTSGTLRIGSVYGGGNGYYAYGSQTFNPVVPTATTAQIGANQSVYAYNLLENLWNYPVWENGSMDTTLTIPSITKTAILIKNDYVSVDTVFGGAKNAFIIANTDTVSAITINGGTIVSVFGGNNVGGSQGTGKHYIKVDEASNTATTNYATRIHTLFGGGNKVAGSETDILVNGGMIDTLYAGGNSASVAAAKVEVNCALAGGTAENTFGHVYSSAIESYSGGVIKTKNNYPWNGTGVYNITALFGGNNQADMEVVPTITLTSGSVGTVYGGGNAGDMNGGVDDPRDIANDFGPMVFYNDIDDPNDNDTIKRKYSTHVKLDKPNVLVDYLYGGCQMSNVYYSAWVEVSDGHVGTVYGGCNISGDVGSNYFCDTASGYLPSGLDGPWNLGPRNERYQAVKGATFVKVSGGTIYQDLFAGSNGRYHCNNGKLYIEGINFDDLDTEGRYIGLTVPTHNETHAIVSGTAEVKGNVYAGGNLASVGFIKETVIPSNNCPRFVGMATLRMSGGHVHGSVFGGGNMASIWGSNAVSVQGGSIDGALYGGNDRIGLVAQITNRVLPPDYGKASDGYTPLDEVRTYISLTGRPLVSTVYGGGNGDYDYSIGQYCNPNDQPVQSNTFVDVNIDGYAVGSLQPGHIHTVYGGGNGVTVTGTTTVFLNVKGDPNNQGAVAQGDHVDFIFGGNNKGPLAILPDIILLKGNVNTVYGGCNKGSMIGNHSVDNTYHNIGSLVRLRSSYDGDGDGPADPVTPTAKVTGAVFGGCRMNGVDYNTLVLVEGGQHPASMFGGSDISGTISGTSQVVVTGGTIGNAFGGGNGNYIYNGNKVYTLDNEMIDTIVSGTIARPACEYTQVDMNGGTAANLYGGGNAAGVTHTSMVNMNGGTVTAGLYGGCCSMDTIHGNVTVNILGGTLGATGTGNEACVFGGGYGQKTRTDANVTVNFGDDTHAPTLYGDVYGGSALGHVNDTMVNGVTAHTTTVNVLNGTINGNVYGGGLGQKANGNSQPAIAALVQGKTYVNIGATDGAANPTYSGKATINGDVYGCNNLNGTPIDSVFVNVYKTAHITSGENTNTYPTGITTVEGLASNAETQKYAIHAVYGGGNQAAYTPPLANEMPRETTVHIFGCQENTVQYVYGGGNAADVGKIISSTDTLHVNTRLIVDGGRIHQSFGGGNGAGDGNPGANIYGVAKSEIYAGLIDEVFGGANMRGSVDTIDLNIGSNSCGDHVFGKVFGCANEAPYNKSITTNILCGVGTIGELYGGSNKAAIGDASNPNNGASVTLNLYGGGPYDNVFAGSKGVRGGTPAPIYGDVTLNLYGGIMKRAFGGSDQNGNITGTVTVNVLDFENCDLKVDTIFGASNLAEYCPHDVSTGVKRTSPVINVMHIKDENGRYVHNVFGGGNLAEVVNANPMVNVGYDEDLMSGLIPDNYPTAGTFNTYPHAYVDYNVFGGGNKAAVTGTDTVNLRRSNSYANNLFGGGNEAGTSNTVVNVYDGTVATGVYGGCNTNGTVTANTEVNIFGGTLGTSTASMPQGIFGGGYGEHTATTGNVTVNIGDGTYAPTVYADVYGGSALGKVNAAGKLTKVNFAKGTLYGNLYGGGLGQASPDEIEALVYGNVEVNIGKDKDGATVDGGVIIGSVFGSNNIKGTPLGNVQLNVYSGTLDSIFGGGNQANYEPTEATISYPEVNVSGGEVIYKVVGGGNAASVTANPHVNISGGTVCSSTTNAGVYGGCNTTGTVDGNITVNITGTTTSQTVIGTTAAMDAGTPISIHGGGYGHLTATTGDVTVNFGTDEVGTNSHCEYPKLYGDLYGGSALGNVNNSADDKTTVNILNGTLVGSNIYGGGLGNSSHSAMVYGEVHVNIGADTTALGEGPFGQASFPTYLINETKTGSNVFGCNNVNGSPQQNVFVDVYQTTHTHTDSVQYMDQFSRTHAIQKVYGGGNRANYVPAGNSNWEKKVHSFIHFCSNTINSVYGGGNAANVDEVEAHVEGGRFEFVFGGGNGRTSAADVMHNVNFWLCSGYIGYAYAGCDMSGSVHGQQIEHTCDYSPCNDPLIVENFYFGANEALIVGGLENTITCADDMNYLNVFAGSRLAVIYGDIKLTVRGGKITNLFGGSQGALGEEGMASKPGDVRRFPSDPDHDSVFLALSEGDRTKVLDYMTNHPEVKGTGGNIYLTLEGGDIENVFGGCERLGNVEGEIVVIIDSTYQECPLDVDFVYGGGRFATITPYKVNNQAIVSPKVYVKNGHVNYDVFGGSLGNQQYPDSVGLVTSNPKVMVGDLNADHKVRIGRNVFGGGGAGPIKGDTKVILQGKTTVNGNVYGGAELAAVNGSTDVVIVTNTHTFSYTQPSTGGSFTVTDVKGNAVSSGITMAEDDDLRITATPAPGFKFNGWTIDGEGASVSNPSAASTTFTMGTENATLTAVFVPVP